MHTRGRLLVPDLGKIVEYGPVSAWGIYSDHHSPSSIRCSRRAQYVQGMAELALKDSAERATEQQTMRDGIPIVSRLGGILLAVVTALMLLFSISNAQPFSCTLVIGYSQVGRADGWYAAGGTFESVVEDEEWELRWENGGAVNQWGDPDYSGWDNPIQSPCAISSHAPDRILLSVRGPYGSDEAAWEDEINAALVTIREIYPSAEQILLQAVVGGPNHQTCYLDGSPIRASWQHVHIDSAIHAVAGGDVAEGFSP